MRQRGSWVLPAVCLAVFAAFMLGLHWLQRGISLEFGEGLSVGLLIGIFTALLAVGPRTGRAAEPEYEPAPRRSVGLGEIGATGREPRRPGSSR